MGIQIIALISVKGDISLPLTHTILVAGNESTGGDVRSQWGGMEVSMTAAKPGISDLSLGHMLIWFFLLSFFFQYMYKWSFSRYCLLSPPPLRYAQNQQTLWLAVAGTSSTRFRGR